MALGDPQDSVASARALAALHSDVQELRADHTNLRVAHDNFAFDQGWVNQCVESIIERLNQVLTEVSLLRSTVQQLRTQYQVSVDALHIRVRVLEQALQLLSTRLGRAEESLTVAEHSFAHLQDRVSIVESQLQLDALD